MLLKFKDEVKKKEKSWKKIDNYYYYTYIIKFKKITIIFFFNNRFLCFSRHSINIIGPGYYYWYKIENLKVKIMKRSLDWSRNLKKWLQYLETFISRPMNQRIKAWSYYILISILIFLMMNSMIDSISFLTLFWIICLIFFQLCSLSI